MTTTIQFKMIVRPEETDDKEAIEAWMNTLSEEQMDEFCSLEKAWSDTNFFSDTSAKHHINVVKDWIEEYGGERIWWGSIELVRK